MPTIDEEVLATLMFRPSSTPTAPTATPLPTPTFWPTATLDLTPDPGACLEDVERHQLRETHEVAEGSERYSLSAEEWLGYLELMGIESLCIPSGFGAPYLNVDWNGFANPGLAIGRMVSIGFERLNDGLSGWSRGYLLYSTYDFEIGTMYQDFAEPKDLAAVRAGNVDIPVRVDGVDGFIRYEPGFPMGGQDIAKTYVFPFEDYYVAAVLTLGVCPYDQVEQNIIEMEAGRHPDIRFPYVPLMDNLVLSILFR